jgi:hypothetical protein
MTAPRILLDTLVVATLALACGRKDAPADPTPTPTPRPAAKAEAKAEHPAIDPKHDPSAMAGGPDAMLAVETEGTMQATMNGVATKLDFLPTGSNVAIVKEDKKIARVKLGGAPTEGGLPLLEISLDGVRLDELTLPAKLEIAASDDDPHVRIIYSVTEQKVWESQPGGNVTIESYAGARVKGTFAAKLNPRSAAFGPSIDVQGGTFDVVLRLNGAKPGA